MPHCLNPLLPFITLFTPSFSLPQHFTPEFHSFHHTPCISMFSLNPAPFNWTVSLLLCIDHSVFYHVSSLTPLGPLCPNPRASCKSQRAKQELKLQPSLFSVTKISCFLQVLSKVFHLGKYLSMSKTVSEVGSQTATFPAQ